MTDDSQRPVILSPPDGTTLSDRSVSLAGTGTPASRILVRDWLRPVAQCEIDEEGRWTATVSDLPSGTHVFVAEWVDPDGAPLVTSAAWTIQVPSQKELDALAAREKQSGRRGLRRLLPRRAGPSDTPEPAPAEAPQPAGRLDAGEETPAPDQPDPDSSSPSNPDVPRIMHPEDGHHVGQTLTLFGKSTAGCTIAILDDAELVGLTESDDTGYWTATVKALTPGIHRMHARSSLDGSEWRLISAPVRIVVREQISAGNVDHA